MSQKTKNANRATIEGAAPELAGILRDYAYESYEVRSRSNGKDSLYIRLSRIRPVVCLAIADRDR